MFEQLFSNYVSWWIEGGKQSGKCDKNDVGVDINQLNNV